jgi:hypothetical protein
MVGKNFMAFASHRNQVTSKSSTDAEVIAGTECFTALAFVLAIVHFIEGPKRIVCAYYSDNENTLHIFRQGYLNNCTRHITIRLSYVLDIIEKHCVTIRFVKSKENPADMLTKQLSVNDSNTHYKFLDITCLMKMPVTGVTVESNMFDRQSSP